MSLVDYASSSEEEEEIEEDKSLGEEEKKPDEPSPPPPPPPNPLNQITVASSHQHSIPSLAPSPVEKLPDALALLSSPTFPSHQNTSSDHSTRVAAAMAESASRKRESNGSALPYQRSKLPRGQLPHSRNIPDTVDGKLIPPQLSGRNTACGDYHHYIGERTTPDVSVAEVGGPWRKGMGRSARIACRGAHPSCA